MQNEKHIDALTGARFTAIMLIVLSHFEFLKQYSFGNIYWSYFHNATMGVDFFFMLSGFGMMLSSMKKNPQGKEKIYGVVELFEFGKKHVKKIYSIYAVMLFAGIPYYILVCVVEYGKTFFESIVESVIQFLGCLTLLQSTTGMTKISHALNGVGWFLSTLFCIYLISPVVMKVLKRTIHNARKALLTVAIVIICSCLVSVFFEYIEQNTMFDDLCYGSPYQRIFYVMCGMIIAQIYCFNSQHKGTVSFEYITTGVSIVWFFIHNLIMDKLNTMVYIVDMVICACVLYALALGKGKVSKMFASKKFVYLGGISMYIFITHYLIRMYIDFIVRQFEWESTITAIIEVVVILSLTFGVSILIDRHYRLRVNNQ